MTVMSFKEYLAVASRPLGIKPRALWMRIYRGKLPMPPVARRGPKRIVDVCYIKPDHSVSHFELVQSAINAVQAVYADRSVDMGQTRRSMKKIKELIDDLANEDLTP